ncbi:MAG: hypothetical protein H0V82_11900 [Candidatus Protochlamydia sp.]|nr:hypothetical protein [Candidatus Protochlamydia sp.]
MSYVENHIRNLDSRIWHGVEKVASKYPNASRFLAIPVAIGILIRDTVAIPARGVEEFYLYLKSKANAEQSQHMRLKQQNEANCYSHCALKCAVLTPFSPLVGTVDAIVSFVKMALFPLKTAKINAIQLDFEFFLQEMNYSDTCCGEDFANEVEFAKASFKRFLSRISNASSHEEVKSISFTEDVKRELQNEVGLKTFYMIRSQDRYSRINSRMTSLNRENKMLSDRWKTYQENLISTNPNLDNSQLIFNFYFS